MGYAFAASAAMYAVIACVAMRKRLAPPLIPARDLPPVTLLKPLCGAEPETYECLRSFCDQSYPTFQVVFGVRDSNDPALAIVERLQREFPGRQLRVVVDRRQHGSSRKVSNLINMLAFTEDEFLVLSDSDVRVDRDYLAKVVTPLLDSGVGIVTCAYRGCPQADPWSMLGALFINEWFMPSVHVAALSGSRSFAFGATIAIRRQVLSLIGGFKSIADQLADDYRLGELTRRLGLRTVLSEVVVDVCVAEHSFAGLVRHELRWLRTIRTLRPTAYGFFFVTFGVPVAGLGTVLTGGSGPAIAMLAVTAMARILQHVWGGTRPALPMRLVMPPIRDVLSLSLWAWSFVTRRVRWREDHYHVARDGSVQPIARIS